MLRETLAAQPTTDTDQEFWKIVSPLANDTEVMLGEPESSYSAVRETTVLTDQTNETFDRYIRDYNDTATMFAEMLNGSMRTPFDYEYRNGELYADDGSPMGKVFDDTVKKSKQRVAMDPFWRFELRRNLIERTEYADMLDMAKGYKPNTMVVVSDYPPELISCSESVGGYNAERKQTFLRVITWQQGQLRMYSQTLDGSNRSALEDIYTYFDEIPEAGELLGQRIHRDLSETEQEFLTDRLTGLYDRNLSKQYGGVWHAGRQEIPHDTYQFVLTQDRLVKQYVNDKQAGRLNENDKYNYVALLSELYDDFRSPKQQISEAAILFAAMQPQDLHIRSQQAGDRARRAGKTFDACGMTLGGRNVQDELGDAGYDRGADLDSDEFGSLDVKCPNGHISRRKPGRKNFLTKCTHCSASLRCDDSKPDYKPKSRNTKGVRSLWTDKRIMKRNGNRSDNRSKSKLRALGASVL